MRPQPRRKQIRLRDYEYSSPGAYFVTICTRDRAHLFGEVCRDELRLNAAGEAVLRAWRALPERFATIELGVFVVMPNHVHGIVWLVKGPVEGAAISAPTVSLPAVVRAFKSISARAVNKLLERSGALWQRSYYEHVIRSQNDLDAIRGYIESNPRTWTDDEHSRAT